MKRAIKLLTAALAITAFENRPAAADGAKAIDVYIGTYNGPKSKGIYRLRLDPKTGDLSEPVLAAEAKNPSFLAITPNHKFIYAVDEMGPAVVGFAVQADGSLKPINRQSTKGEGPCHVTVDASGKGVMVANYSGGSVAMYAVDDNGVLSEATSFDQHKGDAPKPQPLGHAIEPSPDGKFALGCDPGLQRVYVYRIDSAAHKLVPNDPPFASVPDKRGPRHVSFTPNGKFAYVINEQGLSVTAYTFDSEHGVLNEIQTIDSQPAGAERKGHSTAEIIVHPSGKFVYGSNRGDDSIVGYRIDPATGKLTLISHTPTGGKTPRGFGIDPTGQWMIVGNQDSNTMIEFHIDSTTGDLKPAGKSFELGSPVCMKFLELSH